MYSLFLFGACIAYLLFVWFNSNAFVEYMTLFKLDECFYISEFKLMSQDDPNFTYPAFLAINYNNFFTRLLNCPKCIVFWLSLIVSISSGYFLIHALALSFVSLILYHILIKLKI